MGVMSSVVVADLDEAADIVGSERPVDDWKGFEARGLDQAKFAMLHALLSGQYFDEAGLEAVGEELAATEDFEAEAWAVEDVQKIVTQLADLAGMAVAQDKAVFLWIVADE